MNHPEDAYVRMHYAFREDSGAPALDPVDSRGVIHDDECAACKHRFRHWSYERKRYVCGSCGEVWGCRERLVLKGHVDTSIRPGGSEHRLALRIDLGTQFSQFTEDPGFLWPARLYVANCMGWSLRRLHEEAPEAWGEHPCLCSYRSVREAVHRGRREWRRRMVSIGVLRG